MTWHTVKGTVMNEGSIENQARIERTLLVETENGQRVVIAPKDKVLNKLATGDLIEFETQKGKDARLTPFFGGLKRNCRNVKVLSHVSSQTSPS